MCGKSGNTKRYQALGGDRSKMDVISDENRPGLKARTVKQLARDLRLARDSAPPKSPNNKRPLLDVGEISGRRGRAIFLLGAGCSASAKIPLAASVAQRCICVLARRYSTDQSRAGDFEDPIKALKLLVTRGIIPQRFQLASGQGDWGALYTYLFADHLKSPNQQREIISRIIEERENGMNWAHACLGALVQQRYVHTVLTTNFDQLALEGIVRTGITPVVADGLESLTRISPTPAWPQVVHLHGSMHTYDLRNSPTALTETGDDRNLQTVMMSLLKHSTVLVVVGYAGGEEGVMSLLQYAARTIPRMVIYWVAYEKSYRELSPRAQDLLETGENKFFIPDQDADRFFQGLMRELGEGQPSWVADPIGALVEQRDKLPEQGDDEIDELIRDYRARIQHAEGHRYKEGHAIALALQARSEGRFAAAVEALEATKDDDHRSRLLYAQSLQDAYDENPEENLALIDRAILEFEHLNRHGRPEHRIRYALFLIEALFDRLDTIEQSSEDAKESLKEIIEIAKKDRGDSPNTISTGKALLKFYEARATQELRARDEAATPDQSVVDAYRQALKHPSALAEKFVEARDGLAQALAIHTEQTLTAGSEHSRLVRRRMRAEISEAIEIHTGLVEHAWYNQPNADFAGVLKNLASDYEILAKVKRNGPLRDTPIREAVRAMERAVAAYEADANSNAASDAQARLDRLREAMR